MATATKRAVFPNGMSYQIWKSQNCDGCQKAYDQARRVWPCPLERAIDRASIVKGTVTPSIAQRLGFAEDTLDLPPCPEKKAVKTHWAVRG